MTEREQQELQHAFRLHGQGQLGEAALIYERVIGRDPGNADALHYLGVIKASQGRMDEAKNLIERSLARSRNNKSFLENYVMVLFQAKDFEKALDICTRALEQDRTNRSFLYVRASSLFKLRKIDEALAAFDALLKIYPNDLAGLNEKGSALGELGRYAEALPLTEKATATEPRYAEAFLNKGNVLAKLKRHEEALAAYERAALLNSRLSDAHAGCGHVLRELKRFDASLAAYDRALAINPKMAAALLGRSTTFLELRRHGEALVAYDKTIEAKPEFAEAWFGRGNVLDELRNYSEAFAAYDRALRIDPTHPYVEGNRLYAKMQSCDWSDFENDSRRLVESVRKGIVTSPFSLLSLPGSSQDQLKCAEFYVASKHPALGSAGWTGGVYRHDKIRVAYVSADFRQHAIPTLLAGVLESHDRTRFETTGISIGPDDRSAMRERVKNSFDRFADAAKSSDQEIASLVRNNEIDILVDLMGFTQHGRLGIFAHRAAPVQVSYLGYPGTTGAQYMDYVIADEIVIPENEQHFYSEKIVRLPHTYQANDDTRPVPGTDVARSGSGLPASGFVFCCFNNNYKILPHVFDGWMRILKKADSSVLWLMEDNPAAAENLRREAVVRGVSAERLVFAKRVPPPDHLARHRLAGLFLDTLPYNAHTTASDALWAGLPVLTRIGETFSGRVAASLLNAIGLPELITSNRQDYEDLAVELATHPEKLQAIRQKLLQNRQTHPLFDTRLFTRHIEAAYTAMHERQQAGFPPEHIRVPH